MNGWHTIKKVQAEMNTASFLSKDGKKTEAACCMLRAAMLLDDYCSKETPPEHGFESEEIGS